MGTDKVEYRPIAGFPGYLVGSDGSLWSHRAMGARSHGDVPSLLPLDQKRRLKTCHQRNTALPYECVGLRAVPGCKPTMHRVHVIVLEAFVCLRPAGMVACHNDGNVKNNHADNLRWDTTKNNMADMIRHGTRRVGVDTRLAKLTEQAVRTIRCLCAFGNMRHPRIGRLFGICATQVSSVRSCRSWAHLAQPMLEERHAYVLDIWRRPMRLDLPGRLCVAHSLQGPAR